MEEKFKDNNRCFMKNSRYRIVFKCNKFIFQKRLFLKQYIKKPKNKFFKIKKCLKKRFNIPKSKKNVYNTNEIIICCIYLKIFK